MKSVIIGFSKPITFKLHAWIIEKIDRAPFDHAYLRFHSDTLNRDLIYQSTQRGVEFVGLTLWQKTTIPVQEFLLLVDDSSYTQLMQFCVDNAGIPYGFMAVIGEGLVKLGVCSTNPFNMGLDKEFCSEIVARCLNAVDPAQFKLDAANLSPSDLNQILTSLQIPRVL